MQGSDGVYRTLTQVQFNNLFNAVFSHVSACQANEKALADAINAAADPLSVDITTGWPSNS